MTAEAWMGGTDDLDPPKKDFHLKEYELLKKEVSDQVEHTRKLELYAVGGIAAFYAWFMSPKTPPPSAALGIPLLLVLLGAWRSWAALARIKEIAGYLIQVEAVFALKEPGGWETYRTKNPSRPFLLSAAAFWAGLVVVAGVAWVVLTRCERRI
jgi:hypothetical protein